MTMRILHPRLLLFLVVSGSTALWAGYRPLFSYEKYVSLYGIFNYSLFFLIIFAACFITEKSWLTPRNDAGLSRLRADCSAGDGNGLRKEALILAAVAMAAQWLWIGRIVMMTGLGPLIQLVFVKQDILTFKEQIVNVTGISGVTTLTQLGIIASSFYAIYVFGLGRKGSLWIWAFILFPGALRGLFFSERIALLEVLLPILVMAILFGKLKVTFFRIAAAIGAVILYFSIAEGSRSYQYYAKNGFEQEGMYGYGLGRFLDYISSSVNHSMAMTELSGRIIGFPSLLFNGFLNIIYLAVPPQTVKTFLHMNDTVVATAAVKLSPYSAPDYTNMGFFGEIFADSGYLYVFYAILYGCFIGMAYKGISSYQIGWLAVYPIVLFSLLESYRISYLFDNRVFYPLMYIALRYVYLQRRRNRTVLPIRDPVAAGNRIGPRTNQLL